MTLAQATIDQKRANNEIIRELLPTQDDKFGSDLNFLYTKICTGLVEYPFHQEILPLKRLCESTNAENNNSKKSKGEEKDEKKNDKKDRDGPEFESALSRALSPRRGSRIFTDIPTVGTSDFKRVAAEINACLETLLMKKIAIHRVSVRLCLVYDYLC